MSLADKVAAVFENPRAARIHFRLGRLEAHDLYSKRGVRLSVDDVADLRAAINRHPAYSGIGAKQKTSGHGLHAH